MNITKKDKARFWAKVALRQHGCWEWLGYLSVGYGQIQINKKAHYAHRVAYELVVDKILEGLQIDHLCRNRRCVNPAHLEPVTCQENIRRGKAAERKTHCKRGHLLSVENCYVRSNGKRNCRICSLANEKVYRKGNRKKYSQITQRWREKNRERFNRQVRERMSKKRELAN